MCESKNRPFGDQNEANKLIAIMTSRRESIKGGKQCPAINYEDQFLYRYFYDFYGFSRYFSRVAGDGGAKVIKMEISYSFYDDNLCGSNRK